MNLLPLTFGVMTTLLSAALQAAPLRLCMPDVPLPPYISMDPKQPGLLEKLLQDAAAAARVPLVIERQPPVRCRKAMEDGRVDLVPLTPLAVNTALADLPLRDGRIDPEQRLLNLPIVVVRRLGETAWQWDGERFLRHQPRVGVKRGIQAYTDRLARLGLTVDDAAFSSDQLLRKLAAGRVDVALISRSEYELTQSHSPRALEALPQLFMQLDVYLGISRRLDAPQRAQALSLRQELARRPALK